MSREPFSLRFDLSGTEITRLLKIVAFGKILPIGNLRGGPGGRCLAVLTVLHYFGYPLFWVNARYGPQLAPLRRIVRRIRG
jgi:hypothetical protein